MLPSYLQLTSIDSFVRVVCCASFIAFDRLVLHPFVRRRRLRHRCRSFHHDAVWFDFVFSSLYLMRSSLRDEFFTRNIRPTEQRRKKKSYKQRKHSHLRRRLLLGCTECAFVSLRNRRFFSHSTSVRSTFEPTVVFDSATSSHWCAWNALDSAIIFQFDGNRMKNMPMCVHVFVSAPRAKPNAATGHCGHSAHRAKKKQQHKIRWKKNDEERGLARERKCESKAMPKSTSATASRSSRERGTAKKSTTHGQLCALTDRRRRWRRRRVYRFVRICT